MASRFAFLPALSPALRPVFLAALLAQPGLVIAAPAAAQNHTVVVEEWVEPVSALQPALQPVTPRAARYMSPRHEAAETRAIAAFGPFRVLDASTAALVGITDYHSPAQFAALLDAFPQIAMLEFVEAPGTHDDIANLQLGRMIRRHGIATSSPEGGSVRSGAVELFLAGVTRELDERSEFAVHGWLDDRGLGAQDYPAHAPEHRRYIDYYTEMGMELEQARAFYAMTNSVPFESARWLTGSEMREWLADAGSVAAGQECASGTRVARLDFQPVLQ